MGRRKAFTGKSNSAKRRGELERGAYQSPGHRSLVILWQMLLQGQDDAVGDDGGQYHVLEWRGEGELR